MSTREVIVLGGGAAGFFAALACAEARPEAAVTILERTAHILSKVKISGGGRCNVTHACFDPSRLVTYYPRGQAALRGPFSRFQPQDTVEWFTARGVALKTESDGRMFPVSNQSQTIVDALTREAATRNITVTCNSIVQSIQREGDHFLLTFASRQTRTADRLILATGSNPLGWEWAHALGHTIEPPVPSLFTLSTHDPRLQDLAGISVPHAEVRLVDSPLVQTGPLLITHWGFSGPAVLKLSAWGARLFHERQYQTTVTVNWLGRVPRDQAEDRLRRQRDSFPKKSVTSNPFEGIPQRLWNRLLSASGTPLENRWTETSNAMIGAIASELTEGRFLIVGKSPYKDEFVTCGGIRLDDVNFKTLESKRCPHLYFAGEILDIDGITGGFNFQNAWTTGWLAGQAAAR